MGSYVIFAVAKKYAVRYQVNCQIQKVQHGNETVKEFQHAVSTDTSNNLIMLFKLAVYNNYFCSSLFS